jgi:hypothetical protein
MLMHTCCQTYAHFITYDVCCLKHIGVGLIGPATVGGIKPGCMRIGNTGGMLDNIVMSKLYRPGRYSTLYSIYLYCIIIKQTD